MNFAGMKKKIFRGRSVLAGVRFSEKQQETGNEYDVSGHGFRCIRSFRQGCRGYLNFWNIFNDRLSHLDGLGLADRLRLLNRFDLRGRRLSGLHWLGLAASGNFEWRLHRLTGFKGGR